MNRITVSVVAAALLAFAGLSGAQESQGPAGSAGPGQAAPHSRFDCSKAKDPARCQARREEMRQKLQEAKKACEGKAGDERRSCMIDAVCSKAADPQKCHERANARAQKYQEMKAACADKQGDALRACMREQYKKGKQGN